MLDSVRNLYLKLSLIYFDNIVGKCHSFYLKFMLEIKIYLRDLI